MNRRDRRMTMLKPSHYRRLRGERLVGRGTVMTLGVAAVLGVLVGVAPKLNAAAPVVLDAISVAVRRGASSNQAGGAASVYYPNCDAARAAGAAPIYAGQPGYRAALDRDGDGVACEPYRGRR